MGALSESSKRARKPQRIGEDRGGAAAHEMSVDLKCQHLRLSFCYRSSSSKLTDALSIEQV